VSLPASLGPPTGALPVLDIQLEGSGAELVPLLTALGSWCRPALRQGEGGTGRRAPVAVLSDAVLPVAPAVPWAVVSSDAGVLRAAGSAGLRCPDGVVPPGAAYVPPFVRTRLRAARGLAVHPVATWTAAGWQWPAYDGLLPEELVDTALGCAAAAAVRAEDGAAPAARKAVDRALAWGAPLVVSPPLADALELMAGEHVAVTDPDDIDAQAAALAGDDAQASRLSWQGHRWWEDRHDAAIVAARLAMRLLPGTARAAELRLAELGTPRNAEIHSRWAAAAL